jgi:hypothetical protein
MKNRNFQRPDRHRILLALSDAGRAMTTLEIAHDLGMDRDIGRIARVIGDLVRETCLGFGPKVREGSVFSHRWMLEDTGRNVLAACIESETGVRQPRVEGLGVSA